MLFDAKQVGFILSFNILMETVDIYLPEDQKRIKLLEMYHLLLTMEEAVTNFLKLTEVENVVS